MKVHDDLSSDEELMLRWSLTHKDVGNQQITLITEDATNAKTLVEIYEVLRKVGQGRQPLFSKFIGADGCVTMMSTQLGSRLFYLLRNVNQDFRRKFSLHSFNPLIEIYFDCLEDVYERESLRHDVGVECGSALVNRLNGLVDQIRSKIGGEAYRQSRAKWIRRSNKNYQSITKKFNLAFDRHSRLLSVRLDVGFERELDGEGIQGDFKKIDELRILTLDWLRKKFGCGLVFYVWKLEYGLHRGFHYHWHLLFHGDMHRKDASLAREIGEYWKSIARKEKGVYFNCNANKEVYRDLGIGLLDAEDSSIWPGLRYIALYLVRPDFYVALRLGEGRRTLGMSELKTGKPEKPGSKRDC